jgi:hypothetical protein
MKIGTKVWFSTWDGKRLAAVITGQGTKNDEPVYDLTVVNARDDLERSRWAYRNQLKFRM